MTTQPRRFHLQRDHDVSGVSGTGRVANGILWPDGTASLRWIGDRPSTVHWDRLADAEHVHGHGGATRIVWDDQAVHAGGNAEHCPACHGTNPPYPFICPGPGTEQPPASQPTEPFRFTDADGDYLHIGIPTSPTDGSPAVSFHTMAEPVHVPVEEVEGLIAAVRRMAAAQAPAAPLPPADQTALRQRGAEALREHWEVHANDPDLADDFRCCAGAVLAVLPAPADWDALIREADKLRHEGTALHARTEGIDKHLAALRQQVAAPADRAAVLREAADALAVLRAASEPEGGYTGGYDRGTRDALLVGETKLRRMADETAATETHVVADGSDDPEHIDDCPGCACTETQPAMLSPTERTMLNYALNQAQLRIWDTGKYTAEEQTALVSLRRLTAEEPAAGARQDGAQQ